MQHTPGPWKVDTWVYQVTGPTLVIQTDKDAICKINSLYRPDEEPTREPSPEEWANANLIAAAPELLEACKDALDKLETIANKLGHVTQGDTETRETRAILEKAIAKAEGR